MLYLKKLILIFIIVLFGFNSSLAQRVFAIDERGSMTELCEGIMKKKSRLQYAILPKNLPNISLNTKIFIYSQIPIGSDEIEITQLNFITSELFDFKCSEEQKTKIWSSFTQLSPNLYEINVGNNYFRIDPKANAAYEGGAKYYWGKEGSISKFIVTYRPKNNPKSSKCWYGSLSTNNNYIQYANIAPDYIIESIEKLINNNQSKQLMSHITSTSSENQVENRDNLSDNKPSNKTMYNDMEFEFGKQTQTNFHKSDVDINIPCMSNKNENSFALIIANENYKRVADVEFAKQDGQTLREYMCKTLGLDNNHIFMVENATLNDMRHEVNRIIEISKVYKGDCSFLIYYCGHGIPDEKTGIGYLLPIDGYANDMSTAYSMKELYTQLGSIKSNKILLFTDACFSGANKNGDMLIATRGVKLQTKQDSPTGSLITLSACQADEVAYAYEEKGHGLLTYFFLKKLQESNGMVTLGDLASYLIDKVSKTAIILNGKPQTPCVTVSPLFQKDWESKTLFD